MEVARIEGFRCCKAARHHAYFRGLGTSFPTLKTKNPESQNSSEAPAIKLRFLGSKFWKLGFFWYSLSEGGKHAAECARPRCTLYGSPRRGAEEESRRDSAAKPRVARNELPWVCDGVGMSTLKGLCPPFGQAGSNTGPQPFQGWHSLARLPRVARPSQPWAGGLNPFGIEDPCKVQRGRAHSAAFTEALQKTEKQRLLTLRRKITLCIPFLETLRGRLEQVSEPLAKTL